LELISKVVDDSRRERDALEAALRSCNEPCSSDSRVKIQDRLDLIAEDERKFKLAQNDPVRLQAYIDGCAVCTFRDEAQAWVSSVGIERLNEKLDAAGLEREGLETFLSACGASCPENVRLEVRSRLELATKVQADKTTYQEARRDIATLKSYVSSCPDCFYAENARQDISILEQQQREQIKTDSVVVNSLGMRLANLTESLRRRYKINNNVNGVLVTAVDLGSRAAKQGLTGGDVIVEVAHAPVASGADAQKIIEQLERDGGKSALMLVAGSDGETRLVELALQ
jgi:hypothetical protein